METGWRYTTGTTTVPLYHGTAVATCAGVFTPMYTYYDTTGQSINVTGNEKPKERRMYVFEFIFVDRLTGKIIQKAHGVGETESEATMEIDMEQSAKDLKAKDRLATIVNEIGSYKPIERTYTVDTEE
jgi:hypothetical protein